MFQNATSVNSIKRYIKIWKSPKKSFPAFWPPQIKTCLKSIKRCFLFSTHLRQKCLPFGEQKMRLLWDREIDVSSGRMVLKTQNAPSGWIKLRLVWSRKRDYSWCPWSLRNHFLISRHTKMLLGLGRGSYDSSGRMALRLLFLPSGCRKMRLC
jgi:hypothetical protein